MKTLKKQSGGRGKYGDIVFEIGPREDAEAWFGIRQCAIVGGVILKRIYQPHSKKVSRILKEGVLAGSAWFYGCLFHGSYHSEFGCLILELATRRVSRIGRKVSRLLEPIYDFK